MNSSKHSRGSKQRPTLGYLAPSIHGNSQSQWNGVVDAAQKYGIDLICFPGWCLNFPEGSRFHTQANILYDLVGPDSVDGLISWASSLGNHATPDEVLAFHQRFQPLPMLTIGQVIDGHPGVLMDSYEGMCAAITHLIETHDYRRLVFIRGPENHFYAQERYRAYVETLKAFDIPVDQNLVSPPGPWSPKTAETAMHIFLNERHLRPQQDFQAVVCANDGLALAALETLQQQGVQIPKEVAVTGFDDSIWGKTCTPLLTSVAVPFYDTGFRAVELMLAMLRGESAPDRTIVPSRLVIRQSCGCLDETIVQAMLPQSDLSDQTFFVAVEQRYDSILTAIQQALPVDSPPELLELIEHFLTAFLTAMRHDSDHGFIQAFNDILRQSISNESDALTWQQVISTLYQHTLPCFSEQDTSLLRRADNLWQLARLILGLMMQQAQKNHELDTQQQADQFRELGQAMITTFDVSELMDLLVGGLAMLQIPACYVALYEDPSAYEYPQPVPQWSRLMLAYNTADPTLPHGRMELPKTGMRFRSQKLLPDDIGIADAQYAFVVEPLYFREQQIGFMLCQIGPRNSEVYDLLRGQISNALKGALLIENEKKYSYELASAYEEIRILNESLKEENMRMSAELKVVRRLQEMILPLPEELQHIEKLDIVGHMQPADEVGGDYYDVVCRNGTLHIGIGDVTGHGLESGVLMLMTQTAIRTLIEHGETDPKAFLTTLNRTIYKNARRMRADRTLTFALIHYQNGCLKIVGQHEELLVARKNGSVERLNTLDLGFPIGLEQDIDRWVAAATVSLEPGDGIVLYTDGVTEAENLDNEQYGLERLCDVVRQHWEQSAEDVKEAILKDVMGHIGKQKVYDDITLVVLKQQER